ncbi:MAG: tetratricopeptide repeat protein [Desulfobacterales bacterium]|nr:MAG: tetratricopeptide repeat protein [Desulfobacterales bacterium]
MECPKCQYDNREEAKFCGKCSAKLTKLCHHCNSENRPENSFCDECGQQLELRAEIKRSAAAEEGERKHVTVLFSDLSGYAAMSERLDPEEVKKITSRIFGEISQIITKYDGFVEKYAGDAVMALFGVPKAHEDDPVRALRAAKEIHDRINAISPQYEEKIGHPLSMHTGINTGLVVTGEVNLERGTHGVIGDTINFASRLSDMANVGEILISPETRSLIAHYFETEALKPIPIKGKTQPMVPYKVTAELRVHTRIEAAERRGFSAFTGREKELATLYSCLDKVMAGKGQFVTVVGEAGVGKSRLIYEFRHSLDRSKITVLQGHCQSYGSSIPYFPFLNALRRGLNLHETDTPAELLKKAVSNVLAIDQTLEQYLPLYLHLLFIKSDDYPLPEHLQGEELKNAIEEALTAINTLSSKRQPLVLILEDWHWTDEASGAALKHLIGMIANYPLLVVAIYRPGYRARWSDLSYHTPIILTQLDEVHTEKIIKSVIGAVQLPPGLSKFIHARTSGNPFFIEEICLSLNEQGAVAIEKPRAILTQSLETLRLPDTVQAIIRTRLDRLEPDVKEALRLASVIGKEFSRRIMEKLYAAPTTLSQALEKLKTLEMIQQTKIVPEGEYSFKHELTQEIAYETLLLQRRKVLHGLVGEAIEEFYSDRLEEQVNLLQHHFNQAEKWQKAVHYGCQAAQKATRLSQFHEAVTMYQKAQASLLRLPENQSRLETLIDILLQQERLYETMGRRERQQAIIDQLLALLQPDADSDWLAEIYVRQGDLYTQLSRFDEAEQALAKALTSWRALSDATGESRTLRSMGFLRWHQSRYKEAIDCNEAALVIDRQCDDPSAIATDLTNLGAVWRNLGDQKRSLVCLEEALQLYETIQNPVKQAFTRYSIANVLREQGALDRAMKQYQQAHDIFMHHRDRLMASRALAGMASIYWKQGKALDSLRLYKNVVQIAREIKHEQSLSHTLRALGKLLLALNEPQEAIDHLLESTKSFTELQNFESAAEIWEEIAKIYEHPLKDYQKALESFERAHALRMLLNDHGGLVEALQQMGQLAMTHLNEPKRALRHLREALEVAVKMGDYEKQGELLNTMGNIEWHQLAYANALGHYEQSLHAYRELEDSGHVGLMLNSIGVTLLKLGRHDDALNRLREAVMTNRKAGQRLLEGHGLAAIGDVYRDLGEHDQALNHYQTSLNIRREIGDRKGEGWMLHSLALEFAAKHSHGQARDCTTQALAIAQECADTELLHACAHLQDQIPAG